jgi:hypothetical protein
MSIEKKKIFSFEYVREVVMKIIDNLISAKVWIIVGVFSMSAKMVYDGMITGGDFVGLNTVLIATVVAMREVWKTEKVRALSTSNETDKINDMKA